MSQLLSELQAVQVGEIRVNEPLALYTTWKIGGPADVFIIPETKLKLAAAIRILYRHQIPWFVIGKGSNMLIADKGFRGAVIKMPETLQSIRFDETLVYADAACSFVKLSRVAAKVGLTGLEFASGIPGSVGGAVYMNAGAHGSDVSRVLKQAEILLETGEFMTLLKDEMQYSYRHSILQQMPGIVTEAVFELKFGERNEIAGAMATYRDRRVKTQPLQLACAGSVFRNPPQGHAAKLIEAAGLKGLRIGGAEVSALHANFIVNTDHALAQDVLALIEQIQMIVKQQFAVQLVPEVLMIGEF